MWPLYGKQLVDAFMALGNFEMPECISPAEAAVQPGGFANMSCLCGNEPIEVAEGNKLLLTHAVPAGEGTKCRAIKAEIEDFMLAHRCNRDTCLIALGGLAPRFNTVPSGQRQLTVLKRCLKLGI